MIDLSLSRATSRIANVMRMNPVFPTLEHSQGAIGGLRGLGSMMPNFVLQSYNPGTGLGTLVNVGTGELVDVPADVAKAYWEGTQLPNQYLPAGPPPDTTPKNPAYVAPAFSLPVGYQPPAPYTPINPAPWPPTDPLEIHNLGFDCVPIDWHESVPGITTCGVSQSPIHGYSVDQLTGPSAIGTPGVIAPPASSLDPYYHPSAPPVTVNINNTPVVGKKDTNAIIAANSNTATANPPPVTPIPAAGRKDAPVTTPAATNVNTSSNNPWSNQAIADANLAKAKLDAALALETSPTQTAANTNTGSTGLPPVTSDFFASMQASLATLFTDHPYLVLGGVAAIGYAIYAGSKTGRR